MPDMLNMQHINSLPQPFLVRDLGRDVWWPVESICVETGLMQIDVVGKLQPKHISDAAEFQDATGTFHDPESFYLEEGQPS